MEINKMTEEEYFRKNYPDFCYGDKPLSPYWDLFQYGVEFGERQSEKKIEELKAQIEKMKCCHNCEKYKNKSECESFTRLGFCKKWELRK